MKLANFKTSTLKLMITALLYVVSLTVTVNGQTSFETKVTTANPVRQIEIPETVSAPAPGRGAIFDLSDYKPMPLPSWKPAAKVTAGENQIVAHEIATGQTRIVSSADVDAEETAFMVGSSGPWSQGKNQDELNKITNFSDLQRVTNSADYPWRVNVKLIMTFSDGIYVGSGVLIDPRHVLTAGHCVYSEKVDAWASSIRVVPAYENGETPYGDAYATELYSWGGWTVNENFDWDMGYIKLDRAVGALTGWHGYGYHNNEAFFTGNTFQNPGYPAESPYNGQYMYNWFGNYDEAQAYKLYHNNLAYGGQSGSGSHYVDANSNRYVYAVLSHGRSGPQTGHTRMISTRFNSISSQIASNTPSQFDLVALDARVSPSTLNAGGQPSVISFILHNYSSATWSGSVNIKWYLSTNNFINTADVLLQTRTFTGNLGPKQTILLRDTANLPTIPVSTAGGDYWIGVVLDIADTDNGNNNMAGWDPMPVHVNAAPVLSVIPGIIDLGTQRGGAAFSSSFAVRNTGGQTLTGSVSENATWITSLNPTNFSIAPGQTTTINFSGSFPTTAPSSFSTAINVASNAPIGGNQSVTVRGVSTSIITVSGPPANSSWEIGKSQRISWTVSGSTLNSVKIELSRNNGQNYETIVANTPNDGSHDWVVTPPASNQCVIRISEAQSHPNVTSGVSPVFAIILPAPVLVVNPGVVDLGTRPGGFAFSSSFTVRNDGGQTLTGNVSEGTAWITSLNPNFFNIAGGLSTTINFAGSFPTTAPGSFSTSINVTSNAPSNGNQSVTVRGVSTSAIAINGPAPNASWEIGKPQKISWTVTGSAVNNVMIELSRDNGRNYKTIAANTSNDGNEDWVVTPPVSGQCLIRISEAQSHPNVMSGVSPVFAITSQSFEQVTKKQEGGDQQSAYRLFSVPGRLDNPSPQAVLEDDLGAKNPKKWRLFDYRNGGFVEYPGTGDFTAGHSIFLSTRELATIDAGPGKFVGDSVFTISLVPGWNLVANPYNFDIPISALSLNTADSLNLISYTGTWSSPVTVIKPGEGYAIKVRSTATLTIRPNFPGSEILPKQQLAAQGKALWLIRIFARCQQARDENNFAGVSNQASEGWDALDLYEPPAIGSFVMVSFPHAEWGEHADHYTTDFRDAVKTSGGNVWEMSVRSNIDDRVDLSFEAVQEVPSDLEVYLIDAQAGAAQNLRANSHYALPPLSNSSGKTLKLVVGPKAFADEFITATPSTFALQQNYPNPFNPETAIRFGLPEKSHVTLKVFDVAGREVATIFENEELEAGWHQHIWNGRSAQGQALTSGIYFYRLQTDKFSKTLKMTLLR